MKSYTLSLLAGSSIFIIATAAVAQTPAPTKGAADTSGFELKEIIVTARRKDESLQDVPQTVTAVTASTLEKLNITKFEDVQAVAPGVTLSSGNTGYTTNASMRGISFNAESSAKPTVAFYLNDTPVDANFVFQTMFDVGQIEVLRGPQGTLRGRSSPSGAITIATHKPNLSEFGGYGTVTASNLNAVNANGAVNLPIISDVLAVRVAGLTVKDEFDGVRSVHNPQDPESKSNAGRVSATWKPLDTLTVDLTFNRLVKHLRGYDQLTGTGGQGGTVTNTGVVFNPFVTSWPAPPAGFNGPAIASGDRLGVGDFRGDVTQATNVSNGQLQWSFLGQKLTYLGSYSSIDVTARNDTDTVNFFPNYGYVKDLRIPSHEATHELRLASEEPLLDGRLDYTVGAFYDKLRGISDIRNGVAYLQGAFGSPFAAPIYGPPDTRYQLEILINGIPQQTEQSEFANLTWHFTDRTELSVGGRYINFKPNSITAVSTGPGVIALPLAALGGLPSCVFAGFGSTYPGTCDVPIAAAPIFTSVDNHKNHSFIYTVALSHRFTDDFMMYANTGTSWRPGPSVVGVNNGANNPDLTSLINLKDEKSVSYEIGAKNEFLDKRIRLNVSVYHQKFDNLITRTSGAINYLSNQGGNSNVGQFQFTYNADAVVDGVDVDAVWQITPHWNVGGAYSYSDGHVDHQAVPCNDSNFDGVPDSGAVTTATFQTAGKAVALCQSSQSVSRAPLWNTSLQAEYSLPVMANMDAFVRGLYTYYPKNKNASPDLTVDSYGILNAYAGVRSSDGVWELSVFAKNATNTRKTLTKDNVTVAGPGGSSSYFGDSGYYSTTFTPRREVGANVRYAFGSR